MRTNTKRTTIYLDNGLHRTLRIKAAETDRSISDLIQEAIRLSLAEDEIDLAAFRRRGKEPSISFEDALKDLRKNGKI